MGIRIAKENDEYRQSGALADKYSDLNKSFLPNPNTGQITRKVNVESVKQALRNLLLTNKYERLRNPEFGTRLNRFLFEQFDSHIEEEIKEEIYNAIETHEPRVRVIDCAVDSQTDNNAIVINIEFAIITSNQPANLELTLYRVR